MNRLYYDDFEAGKEFTTGGRTITEAVVTSFAGVSGDMHNLHLNKDYGRKTIFGKNIAHGLCFLSVASGDIVQTGIFENIVAFFSIQDWRFMNPVFYDDTVRVKIKVFEKRESSKNNRGTISFDLEIVNQKDEIVQKGQWAVMISRKSKKSN